MPYRANYPRTMAEVLSDRITFRPDALRAVKAFRRSKPWRGTARERLAKFRALNAALSAAYGITPPQLKVAMIDAGLVGNGYYMPGAHAIGLVGKLSVVTFLHEFAHARGMDERQACRWSINLFRRVFPQSFARLNQVGHTLRQTEN